jgi:hypothetical protein
MTPKPGKRSGLELLEEAIHLLRATPMQTFAYYYIGALPFVLALLYFLADMSKSADASSRLPGASLCLCILFVWMKCWHGAFTSQLMAWVGGQEPPRWTAGSIAKLVLAQGTVGPVGLVVAAMAIFPLIGLYVSNQSMAVLIAMVPLGGILLFVLSWPYAYFQSATVILGNPSPGRLGGLSFFGAPARAASCWPGQNLQAMLLLSMLGLLVWANIVQAMLLPPFLMKKFLDVETVFSRGGFDPSNTTFLAIGLGLTYLLMDPLVKAFYTLRCFYWQSFHNGQDLLAELKAAARAGGKTLGVLIVLLLVTASPRPSLRIADCGLQKLKRAVTWRQTPHRREVNPGDQALVRTSRRVNRLRSAGRVARSPQAFDFPAGNACSVPIADDGMVAGAWP